MFANRRLVSEKNPVDHKLLMQIRNGHLNEGFNSRKSSSTSTKPISKYNLLHSYFECNFNGEYSKRIAQELKRQIKSCNKHKQAEPTFIDSVREKIIFVHNYNIKVSTVTFAYPLSNEFVELLIQYVLIESRALYRRKDHIAIREATVQDRVLRILVHIFNTFFESKMMPPKEVFEKSAKAIINIFIEIKRDYGVNNKLMENMTIKLLKRAGLFEKIDALKGQNLPCPLDTFLTDHAYSDINKTTITSDYGTDDGFQMDDDVQIVDDDIVDITASESNEIKEEYDYTILNKTSTSPLTKLVPTICLDDSDLDSDEETLCFAEEVKTSQKSLEYQRHQRQDNKISFHERNHRPIVDVKTEEEVVVEGISTEKASTSTQMKVKMADQPGTYNCKTDSEDIESSTQNITKEISKTSPVKLFSKDGDPEEDSLTVFAENISEKDPGLQSDVKVANIETTNGLAFSRSGEFHDIECRSSNDLHDNIQVEEASAAETVAVSENNPSVVEVDKSVEQPTTNDSDSCFTKTPTIIDPSLHKINFEIKEVPSESDQEEKELSCGKDGDFVSNEDENINQSNTSEGSDLKKLHTEASDIPNTAVCKMNHESRDSAEEREICQEDKISEQTESTSTEYTDTLLTENLIVNQIKTSISDRHSSGPMEDKISTAVEIDEKLLEKLETGSHSGETNSVVDGVGCAIKVITNYQPEPLAESVICQENTEIGTSRVPNQDENKNESSKEVTDVTNNSMEFENRANQDGLESVMIVNSITSKDCEDKNNSPLSKPVIDGTESNEDNVDLLPFSQPLISDENLGCVLSEEKLHTVVNDKVITKGLEEMGSHILSLKQIAENIIQTNHLRGSLELVKSSVLQGFEKIPSTSIVSSKEGENVEAEKEADGLKCPFIPREPNQDKFLDASLPCQPELEIILCKIEEKAITDPNLQSKILETNLQQINTGWDPNSEQSKIEKTCEHQMNTGTDTSDENNTGNSLLQGTEIDGKAIIQDSIDNSSSQPTDVMISKQKDKEEPEDIMLSNEIIDETLCKKSSTVKVEHFENPQKNKQLHEIHKVEYSGAAIVDKSQVKFVPLESGEQKSCTQEKAESKIYENSDHSNELVEHQKPTEIIEEQFQGPQTLQDVTSVEKNKIGEELSEKDPEFAIEVEVGSDDAQSNLDVEHVIPNVSIIQENAESNIEETFAKEHLNHSHKLAEDQRPTESIEETCQSTQPLQDTTLMEKNNIDEQLFNNDSEFAIEVEVGSDDAQSELDVEHIISNVSIDGHAGEETSCDQENFESSIGGIHPSENSVLSDKVADDQKPTENIDTVSVKKSNTNETLFNKDSEFAVEVEVRSDDTPSELDEQKSCIQENVNLHVHKAFCNENSDHLKKLAEDEKPAEIIEETFQNTQPHEDTISVERTTDEQLFNKDSEFSIEVEVGSDDAQSELDVEHIISNVSIDGHAGEETSCDQENFESSIGGIHPSENSVLSHKVADDLKPTENIDTVSVKKSNIDETLFNKDSEFAVEVEVRSDDASSELDVKHMAPSVCNDGEQKSSIQENVNSHVHEAFCNENSDHFKKLAEDEKPAEIIEETFQNRQPHKDTISVERTTDEQLFNKDSEFAIEVEVGSDDTQSELDINHIIPNISIDSHNGEQKSSIQENIELNIEETFSKETSEMTSEIIESEKQVETVINREYKNQDTPRGVEYFKTNIKECDGESDKVEEQAKIEGTPTALAKVEELLQKPSEHLFEFHNEFAIEVEIGTEAVHSDADINNIGELCNVTDQDKIVHCDSFIGDPLITSATEKHLSSSPDQNAWRTLENLHTSIITESQDVFGQQDSGIASNSGSSDDQDNQSIQDDIDSKVDLSLRLKRNGVDIFVQNDVTALPRLDVLAIVAADAPRERVIKEQKPLRRGRSSKAENDKVNERNRKKQPSSTKVSKCKVKIEQTPKLRTHQTEKKVAKTSVNDNIRVTRSSHLKNSNEIVETSFKPHDFLSVKNSIPPANKMYADRVVDVNFTSEDSNDSESNKLMIDEGSNAKLKDIKSKSLLDPLNRDEVDRHINEAKEANIKSEGIKSEPLQNQLLECRIDIDVSQLSDNQIQVDEDLQKNSEDIVKDVEISIYDEDSLDEELHFCYEPKVVPNISVQQNEEVLKLAEEHQQIPPLDKKDISISRPSLKNSKTSFESNKPVRTKAERKAYNQSGPNPFISIERLNVSTTAKNVPNGKKNRSKSLDVGVLQNIVSKSKKLHSKENLKHQPTIKVEPKKGAVENTESVMIANIKEDINNTELTEDNVLFAKLSENSERNGKLNELGDFDETPLAERIKKESQEALAELSLPEKNIIKTKQKSKRLKKKWIRKKRATKINKISGEPNVQDAYEAAAKPKKEQSDNLENKNISQEKKPTGVFHSLATIDSKKVDDIQIKFENLEESSNKNYCTLPKLRRKSMSKDNLNRSVISKTILISTGDIKDEDKKCMPPPKLRGKSYTNSEAFKEQWRCKNTVSQTTEKLMKKLCEEVTTNIADVELMSDDTVEEQVNSSFLGLNIEIPLSQKPLADTVEQPQYKLCERNLLTSELSSDFSNLVNPSLKKVNSSDSILTENFVKSVREESLYENDNESNDIVYDLSLKPSRKVHKNPDDEKPATVNKAEEIPIIIDYENVATVNVFTEQDKAKGKLESSSNEKPMACKSDFASAQSSVDIQKDDIFTKCKKSVEVESDKPDSPEKYKGQPLGNCSHEKVEDKSLDELPSPSKMKAETVSKLDLLNDKSFNSAVDYSNKNKLFNNLQDLNTETFKSVSESRNEADECAKTRTDIATNLSQTNCYQKNKTPVSKIPDLPSESNKTLDLSNEESVIKNELGKRKYEDLSEGSEQKHRRKSRKVDTDLNVAPSTAADDIIQNSSDANLIKATVPGCKVEKTPKNEKQEMKSAKQKVSLSTIEASKSPQSFNLIDSKKQPFKKTDGARDDIEDEEFEDKPSQTVPTPEANVCLDFSSKTGDLDIQGMSSIVEKQVQFAGSTTKISTNSGEIDEHMSTSGTESSTSSLKKSCPKTDSESHTSGEKKIDAVEIVKQVRDVPITKNVKRKFRPRSKSKAHTAKDTKEDIECDSTQKSSSRLNSANKIASETKKPLGKRTNKIIQVCEKPLQEISSSISRSCTDNIEEIDEHLKKLNKTSSKLQPIVKENLRKIKKENLTLEIRLSVRSRSQSNINNDILEVDNKEIVKDQNIESSTISRPSPLIEGVCEKYKAPSEQIQNKSLFMQKPNKITEKDVHSNNENQTSIDFSNNDMFSNPVSLEETKKIHSSDNTDETEVTCYLKDELSSTGSSMKNDQEVHLETQGRSCKPDHADITDPEAETFCLSNSLNTVLQDSHLEEKEIPHNLDSSVVFLDKEMNCDHHLKEKTKLCGLDCLDNIKQDSFRENVGKSDIHSLGSTLQKYIEPQNETSTNDYSMIIDSGSISVSNEIELGRNVVEEKLNDESVDEYAVSNTDVTDNNPTIDESNAELTSDTGNISIFSSSKYVGADLMSHFLKSESIEIIDGNSGLVAENAPVPLHPDLVKEKMSVINSDLVQELSETEVVKMNAHEDTSRKTDLPGTCKRERIITSKPDSEKPADESITEKATMRELTILIDNSTAVSKYSLSESPRKRERKSIKSGVNYLKEKEKCSSFNSTNYVTVESVKSVKSGWISSTEGGCNGVFTDFNWLKSDEIPDIHSEVVVSSDQPALIPSLSQEEYTNQNFAGASCTMNYDNHSIEQEALVKITTNIDQVTSCNKDLNPLHFIPDDDIFELRDSGQATIVQSSKTSNMSEDSSPDKAIKPTIISPTESSVSDANVEETFQNLANLRHFGKMQTNASSFVCSSIIPGNSGNDKPDFAQMMSVESGADHSSSEIRQPGTLASVYNVSTSSSSDSRSESVSATSDMSLNYHDISPCRISIGSTPTLDLIATQNYDQLNQNILGQISSANSFIAGVSGAPNEITGIIPVSKQADFSQSFKNSYESNNSDHSYHFPSDPVMSIAGEDIFPKGMSDASSELPSNDNPLRDFELSDDFSEFLNTKQVSEEKDSEGKDSESNQNDDYKLRIDNETITQNLVEISRSRQSKEINKLYDLLDSDRMEPDYTAEPSRDPGLWESIMESDQTTQKVIVLPNNHCLTSPFDMTHTELLENDYSTQKVIVEPNNHCVTPTLNMSHTDLYNSFDPVPQFHNPMPPVTSETMDSSLKEIMRTSLAESENKKSTLDTSKEDPKKDCLGDLKEHKKTKRNVPKKIEKLQPDILPTRSYGRTKPSKWIKSSNPVNNPKGNQSSSSPVEKQALNTDPSNNSSEEVVSTDNLLELSFTKSARILPEKPIVIQGIAATKTIQTASARVANTPSVSVKEPTRQTISEPDTPKTKPETPIIQLTARNLNEKVHSLANVNANIANASKPSGAGLLPRVVQYKVAPVKHDHRVEKNRNSSCASMEDIVHEAVVQNIADIVKSRKRVATNLYSSRSLTEENVKNSSHYRPKRRKTPTELHLDGKLAGNVSHSDSPGPTAEVIESRRSQSRGSSPSSVEPTSSNWSNWSQERDSRAGSKRYPNYQGHSRDPYLPEQRRSSGGYYPSTGSSRHSNYRQHSGVNSSRSNATQPSSSTPQQNSRSSMLSPRGVIEEEEYKWSDKLIDRGLLDPLSESTPQFFPQKSPRDK